MDIILLERVEKLGSIGDVVTVKDGYARNFLLPNKKALRSNAANRKVFEANRAKIEADNAARKGEAEKASSSVEGTQIVLIRAASNSGQLYGSVSVRDIVEELNSGGANVTKGMIVLERPIKTLGLADVRVVLHPEVTVNIQVNVARSEDEAELQKDGVDVITQMFEEEQAEAALENIAAEEEAAAARKEAEDRAEGEPAKADSEETSSDKVTSEEEKPEA